MNEHELSTSEVQEYWDRQNDLFARIKKCEGFGEYVKTIENLGKLFNDENRSVCCMDERTSAGTIRYAGSGILDQTRAAQCLQEAGATGVYSHAGCGAATLAFSDLSQEEKKQFADSEDYAQWWAKKVAADAGIAYQGHLEVSPSFHIARVTYYDGTGMFDTSRASELPLGFVISRRYLDSEYAASDLKLSIDIAFGPYGFGKDRFTNDAPFVLVVIGDPIDDRFSLKELIKEAKKIAEHYDGNVVVDGFVAPIINEAETVQEELEPLAA